MEAIYEAALEIADPLRSIKAELDRIGEILDDRPTTRELIAGILLAQRLRHELANPNSPQDLLESVAWWTDNLMRVLGGKRLVPVTKQTSTDPDSGVNLSGPPTFE